MTEDLHGEDSGTNPADSATNVSKVRSLKRRTAGYVVLDSTWARRLGVRRSGGMYRITRRELMERLSKLQQTPIERILSPLTVQDTRGLAANELDDIVTHDHSHLVGFYETEAFLVDSVRDFLASGLATGGPVIVVATDAHRDSFDRALMEAGIELHQADQCGQYIALDAFEALATFTVDGMPDAARFRATIGELVYRAGENARGLRIYGEMVAVLWDEGNVAAAIALEDLWNDLATSYPFSLFCAYPMRAFGSNASNEGFQKVCDRHSKVLLQGQGTQRAAQPRRQRGALHSCGRREENKMGTLRRGDGDIVFDQEGVGQIRRVESGDVTVEFGHVDQAIDPTPLFRGLPAGMCQCRHQGYVVSGRLTFTTKNGLFDVAAGEAFDVSPGHVPLPQAGCEWVQFTATADQRKTDEVIRRNIAAGTSTGYPAEET